MPAADIWTKLPEEDKKVRDLHDEEMDALLNGP